MMKLKIPHKKKAMNENTIAKPKRSLRSKHKREKSKKTTAIKKERPKKKRKDRTAKERTKRHILRNLWQKLSFLGEDMMIYYHDLIKTLVQLVFVIT